jgi:predicted nucleic-acid-binding protein
LRRVGPGNCALTIEPRSLTGVDTNILVRFFAKDDLDQIGRAREFLRTLSSISPGFVSLISVIEMVWVLRSRYGTKKTTLMQCLEQLLNSSELVVESHAAVAQALHRFASNKADFADCLIERCGHLAGCKETVTFDQNAARSVGMRLL